MQNEIKYHFIDNQITKYLRGKLFNRKINIQLFRITINLILSKNQIYLNNHY